MEAAADIHVSLMESPDDLFCPKEAATYVGCSRTLIDALRRQELIPQAKRGPGIGEKRQRRLYRRADLDAYKRSLDLHQH